MKSIIVIGSNLIGLYSAIKLVDLGYDVSIIEKKDTLGNMKYNNYCIFNKNHTMYINLLNKFNINYSGFSVRQNERLFNILTSIISTSRLIPKKNIVSHSFAKFCRSILTAHEYEVLRNNLEDFDYIYANMNAMDCITMLSHDITYKQEYLKLDDDISVLIKKVSEYLTEKKITVIRNTEVRDIKYDNGIYMINNTYQAHIIVMTLCKKNLMQLKVWTKEQKSLLNSVSTHYLNTNCIFNIMKEDGVATESLAEHTAIRNKILEKLHISYPIIKSNQCSIDMWNIGINSIIIREKIKNISPTMFICNLSHSKNAFFINYGLETFDVILSRITRICASC
jgi:hypothetical protein